jgi:hypothetical protein
MNNKIILIASFLTPLIILAVLLFTVLHPARNNRVDISCISSFESSSDIAHFSTHGYFMLQTQSRHTGIIRISAILRVSDADSSANRYRVARDLHFKYAADREGNMTMRHIEIHKRNVDTITDELFNRYMFSVEPHRQYSIVKMKNAYLIGNGLMPLWSCVNL